MGNCPRGERRVENGKTEQVGSCEDPARSPAMSKQSGRTWRTNCAARTFHPSRPADLTDGQREIFQFIVSGLVASDILGQLDVFVLESTAVAIDRLRYINGLIDADPGLVMHTGLQNARAKYQSDLWRGCNELCLSPQARAKIGSLAAQKQKKEKDPLLAALSDDD